uniref:Uncharacterized protein n=1 Tax=uncultured alpha proteobacterium HF0070_17D04 TaxID=710805 RepID=E0XS92_9PROT|nr:hypothetical protein [uncultured alpha proteobacterium HF0070_17D04]
MVVGRPAEHCAEHRRFPALRARQSVRKLSAGCNLCGFSYCNVITFGNSA